VLGVAGAFLREAFDRRIRTEDDATDASGAPVLATVRGSMGPPLGAVTESSSPSGEAYRRLRASLSAALGTQGSRTLVVSSASEREGRTAVAANLAVAFAQAGLRVAAVDANLRDPQLAAMFGLAPPRGLTDVVRDELTLRAVLQPLTGRPLLTVVGAGSDPSHPGELLASRRAVDVLRELDEAFDVVIVDSPPLLEFSDGAVIAQASSGVIVVARSGSTRADDLRGAVDALRNLDARTLGVVLYHEQRGRYSGVSTPSRSTANVPNMSPLEGERLPVR
jgi:capsular exopolysaccharide synthesis family protein